MEDTNLELECSDEEHCVCCGDEDDPEPPEGEDLDLKGGQ
jgi:hypothetical protein